MIAPDKFQFAKLILLFILIEAGEADMNVTERLPSKNLSQFLIVLCRVQFGKIKLQNK